MRAFATVHASTESARSNPALLFLVIALAACGPKVRSQVRVQLDPLPSDHEVKAFASELPRCAYQEVGIIASNDMERTLNRARDMGA